MATTTLILPDIHHETQKADKIIDLVAPDKIIFLGDYFDDYGDSPEVSVRTAIWLANSLRKENRIHLLGNHEHYSHNKSIYICSGYTRNKSDAINSILPEQDWAKLRPYHIEGNILFSHAGLTRLYARNHKTIEEVIPFLDQAVRHAESDLILNKPHWIYSAGYARGGQFSTGGLIWCDFNHEFKPANVNYSQIFGHTPSDGPKTVAYKRNPRFIKDGEQFDLSKPANFCLDSRARSWYALIQDNVLTVKKYKPEEN